MANIEQNDDRSTLVKDLTEPVRARPVTFWWAISALTLSLILALGGIILARDLARIFALVVIGVSIANALAPVVNWLEKHIHLPRTVGILLVYLLLVLIFVFVLWMVIPVLVGQVKALVTQIEAWIPQIADNLSTFGLDPASLLGSFSSIASRIGGVLFTLPATIFSSFLDFVLVIFVSLYWLVLMNGIRGFFLSFFPEGRRAQVHHVLSEMGGSMGGYLRGSAIDGVIFATAKYIGLLIIGVPYALTLGILAFVLEFFPTIGAIVSATVATLVALSVSPTLALITLIFTILLQQGENHILVPLVMRSQTSISPLLAVLAVVGGGAIGGILGAVAGIPIVSALDVLVRLVIAPAIRRANGAQSEALPVQETEYTQKELQDMPKIDSQPYDSSDLSELMDNTGGWAKSWEDIIWYIENVADYDADFAKDEIQPIKQGLEKVKKENKPFTTDYRELYKDITGKDCNGCPPPKEVKSHGLHPREIADKWLNGLKFPAEKHQAVVQAKKNNAPEQVINTLAKIEDQEYQTIGALLEGVGDVSWDHD